MGLIMYWAKRWMTKWICGGLATSYLEEWTMSMFVLGELIGHCTLDIRSLINAMNTDI
jgi:hypothetical protein